MTESDNFLTLAAPSEGVYKSKGSKFYAYAYRLDDEQELNELIQTLKDQHHKARHWCYAYRIGLSGDRWRANDDGEPSNSAGRPILGQIDSAGLSNVLIVVVRYFGGTKLGIPGLIEAYREAAADALGKAELTEEIIERKVQVRTSYTHMSELMQAAKADPWRIVEQSMEAELTLVLACAASKFEEAYTGLWLVLAKAYPGEENLEVSPEGYVLTLLD